MHGNAVLAHTQNLTNHRGDDMCGHFEHGPLTTFNYVKLHANCILYQMCFNIKTVMNAWIVNATMVYCV